MAKRKSSSVFRRSSRHRSTESVGSGVLNPESSIVDEEQTLWWNHLQESTFSSPPLIYSENETAEQLSINSQMDPSQTTSEWWKNLDNEPVASTSLKRRRTAVIIKTNILQTSTSESEKEIDLKKRKVHLKAANNRKSSNNAFANALDDSIPLQLQMKRTSYSNLHSDSNRETSREKSQENEEDSNLSLTGTILKSKPSISRKTRREGVEERDQNVFQDALDDTTPSKLRMKRTNYSNLHSDSDRETSRRKSQENEEDSNLSLTGTILKSKPSISRKTRREGVEERDRNGFQDALDDIPLKLRMKRTSYSNLHSDSDRETSRGKSQENEEDSNLSLTGTILKSKPSISRKTRREGVEERDQNVFQDALDDTIPSKLRMKQTSYSNLHSDSNRETSRGKSQENEEDSNLNLTGTILKSKPSVSRKTRREGVEERDENVLDDTTPSKLRMKQTNYSNLHSDSNRETSRGKSQENEEDSNLSLTGTILKSEPSISKKTRREGVEERDQNVFQDALDDTTPSKLGMKRTNYSNLHSDSDRETSRRKSQENEEDSNLSLTGTILKSKPSISRKTRRDGVEEKDQNVFQDTLDDTTPSKLQMKRTNYSNLHSDSDRETSRGKSQENEEDSNLSLTGTILKSKPSISRKMRREGVEEKDQNVFQDALDDTIPSKLRMKRTSYSNLHSDSDRETSRGKSQENKEDSNLNLTGTILKSKPSISRKTRREDVEEKDQNIFNDALDDTIPSKLRMKRTSYSNLHSDTIRETSRRKENEDDSNLSLTGTILKLKPSISRKTRREGVEERDQNVFQDVLTEDDVLSDSRARRSVAFEKESSKHPMQRSINMDKDHTDDQRKSMKVSQAVPLDINETDSLTSNVKSVMPESSNANEIVQSKIKKSISKNVPKKSLNWIAEEDNNIDSEINTDDISRITSTRISKVITDTGIHKSTILSTEMEIIDDQDAGSARQTIQRNSTSTKIETGNKAVSRQSILSSNKNKISIKDTRETANRQKSLSESQNYRSTSIERLSRDISFNKQNSSKTLKKIDDFFKVKQTSQKSQDFNSEKMEKIKTELEKIKNREMAAMKIVRTDKEESALKMKNVKFVMPKQGTKKKPLTANTKVVDKAFLVNGKVYKAPRLPRPKYWVTNRLYKFLWDRLEPNYKLATRLKSEKFVQELAKIVALIERRKNYENYKAELRALMKEMARLKIINTRMDFYHFCQDFLPYEFRVKVVPMLMPGNKSNIPYDPEKLHTPLLCTE